MQIHIENVVSVIRFFKDEDVPMIDEYLSAGTLVFYDNGTIAEIKGLCTREGENVNFNSIRHEVCTTLFKLGVKYLKVVRKGNSKVKVIYLDCETARLVREKFSD